MSMNKNRHRMGNAKELCIHGTISYPDAAECASDL